MGGTPIRALALVIPLALPGCAWLGPSPAQQQIRDARRARSEASEELAPKHKTVEERLAEAPRYLPPCRGGPGVGGYLHAHPAHPSDPAAPPLTSDRALPSRSAR